MTHHRGRRFVEPFDLKPGLVPDRQADRPKRLGHSLLAQPLFGSVDQPPTGFFVAGVEEAPVADPLAHVLLHQFVDLGTDPADHLAAAFGEPEFSARMLEPGILARGDEAVDLVLQRRHPGGVVLVDLPCEVDEQLLVLLGADRADGEIVAAHG